MRTSRRQGVAAVGMAGMVIENMHHARIGEASRLASECMALVDRSGNPR